MSKQELIEKAVNIFNGKWPSKSDLCVYMYKFESENIWGCGSSSLDSLFTREEFNAAADRMRAKPDWKDAPEWACWLAQSSDGKWHWYPHHIDEPVPASGCFLNKARACCAVASKGNLLGDWRNTLEKRPEHIGGTNEKVDPAPAKPWFEAGELPPVGSHVEYMDSVAKDHVPVFIVAAHHFDNTAVIFSEQNDSGSLFYGYAHEFRQIRTEREKFIESAMSIGELRARDGAKEAYGRLFDAGFRAPDQK